jgi:hypothetical protein
VARVLQCASLKAPVQKRRFALFPFRDFFFFFIWLALRCTWSLLITMRSVVAFICLALLATMGSARVAPGKIQNFVVVMMENRAFDHMLGYMNTINPEIRGLTGNGSDKFSFASKLR